MKKATTLLKEVGLKVTPARQHILTFLIHTPRPIPADEICKHVEKEFDQATVYRTLNTFVEKDIIHQLYFQDTKAYFEFQTHHHHHITCTSCGTQEEIDICPTDKDLLKNSKHFSDIQKHVLEFFGICKQCKN